MENTYKEILESATLLFLEKGYDKVSMNDIANYVGISKPSIYYHFESKEKLFYEIVKVFFEEDLRIIDPYKNSDYNFKEALKLSLNETAATLAELARIPVSLESKRFGYYFLFSDAFKEFKEFRKTYLQYYDDLFKAIKIAFIRAQKKNEVRKDLHWKDVANLITMTADGAFYHNTLFPEEDYSDIGNKIFDLIWSYIKLK